MCYVTELKTPNDTSTSDPDNFEDSMAWCGRRIFNSLHPGYEAGDLSQVTAVSKSMATNLPPCGGNARDSKRTSWRKWFGRIRLNSANLDDCAPIFCGECHSRTVKGTLHDAHYSQDLTDAANAAKTSTIFRMSDIHKPLVSNVAKCGAEWGFCRLRETVEYEGRAAEEESCMAANHRRPALEATDS